MLALALALAGAGAAQAGEFFTLKGHGGPIKDIEVAADGRILTASFDNSVGLWTDGVPRWLEGHRAAVTTVRDLGDGRALSGGDDFDLRLWTLATGESVALSGHRGKVMDIAVSPNGRRAASAGWDGAVGIWDLDRPGDPPRLLRGHASGVNAVAFAAGGTRLYSGSSDGAIRVWDAATGAPLRLLLDNGFGVNRIVLDEAAGWLAYGAVDGVTRIVDPETGATIRDLTLGRRPVLALAADPAAGLLAIGDGEGHISIVETEGWRFVADFRATLRGPVWALHFAEGGQNIHAGGLDSALYSWPVDGVKDGGHDGSEDGARMMSETPSFLVAPDTVGNGARQYIRKCSICHALGPDGGRRAGPTLHGVFGRPAGALDGYPYSETLAGSDIVWTAESIDALFDIGPDAYIAGTKMPQQRITDPQDRRDLIGFLQEATASGAQ